MRMELEHSDVIKALAVYLKTKGFAVEPLAENFSFKDEGAEGASMSLLVTVKNADIVSPEPATPPPPRAPTPAPAYSTRGTETGRVSSRTENRANTPKPAALPRPAPAPKPKPTQAPRMPPRNDPYNPVAPPSRLPPLPNHRILDAGAASSTALLTHGTHSGMPATRGVVHAYNEKTANEDLVEPDEPMAPQPPQRAPQPTSELIVAPERMTEEEQRLMEEIMARSQAQAEEGPHYATDEEQGDFPLEESSYVEDE